MNAMAEDHELSESQLRLKNKVLNSGRGITIEQAIGRASNAIKSLRADFASIGERDLDRMRSVIAAMGEKDANHTELSSKLYIICHEMRGTAGTFGFQVASIAANKLCHLMDTNRPMFDSGNALAIAAAKVHIDAISLILTHGPATTIGPAENNMLDGLSALAKKLEPTPA